MANAGAPDAAQIVIKDFMFMPASLTVKAGSTVTWANKDDEPHTVVSDNGLFRSGAVDTSETFAFKFDNPASTTSAAPFIREWSERSWSSSLLVKLVLTDSTALT